MKPSVGRIVHFIETERDNEEVLRHYAAIITRVWNDSVVNLTVFDFHGGSSVVRTSIEYGQAGDRRMTWHWPEREEEGGTVEPEPEKPAKGRSKGKTADAVDTKATADVSTDATVEKANEA